MNDIVFTAIEPKIMATSTFKDLLRMAKEHFESTTRCFDNIQNWLCMSKRKDEPVSTFMEKIRVTAVRIKVANITEDEWIIHQFHQSLPLATMKEIRSYLDPGVKLDMASSQQVINAAIEMETFSKDWRSISRSNKLQGQGDRQGGKGKKQNEDVECY